MAKKALSIILSLLLAVVFMPSATSAVFAADDGSDNGGTIKELQEQLGDQSRDPFDYSSKKAAKKAIAKTANYPDQFDLRAVDTDEDGEADTSYVTPVKFQNPFGSCWGFAAIAAAESSILSNPELNDPNDPTYSISMNMEPDENGKAEDGKEVLDLSEKHLVYFVQTPIDDPSSSQNGEGNHTFKNMTASERMDTGGLSIFATSLFASGMGPNLESRTFEGYDEGIMGYHGLEKSVEQRYVKFDGKTEPFCYDDEDDWGIPEALRFKQSFVLKESFMLPSPAHRDEDTDEYSYNEAGTAAIKDQLMQHRAVQISFCADTYTPKQEGDSGQYINSNWAHYTYDPDDYANHSVTIVGWDDTIPAEFFRHKIEDMSDEEAYALTTPDGDGAWLIKNSWGSGERAFPNRGMASWGIPNEEGEGTGYFWLSYYDKSLDSPEALEFDESNVEKTYNLDEYDFMPVMDFEGGETEGETHMANVFKAAECQTLKQISCETGIPGSTVKSEVYLLQDDFKDPTDGVLMDTVESGPFEYGGFHKIPLNKDIIVQKGQYYSVVQTQQTPESDYVVNLPMGMTKTMAQIMGMDTWQVGVINKKESYISIDGKWYDYSLKSTKSKVFGDEYVTMLQSFDNFPIKGYAEPTNKNISMRVSGETKLGKLNPELRDTTLRLSFKGSGDVDISDAAIDWKIADDTIASIEVDSDDPTRLNVTAKKIGVTYITAEVEGVGTKVVRIDVLKDKLTSTDIAKEQYVYTGKAIKPKVTVFNSLGDVVGSSHYTVTYQNNKKCGKATYTVKAKATDATYRGTIKMNFKIIPAKAVIRKMAPGKKKLTVTIKNQKKTGVTGYQFKYKVKGTSKWLTKNVKAGKTKYTLTKLKKGKRYVVKVRAKNSKTGFGKFSKAKTSKKIK
ncbi:MAG: fibronectin type III domain-containing protein [Firmicutes bacterium]|nr:fibronectin type III domain-containing protein [Bacillota bacterium]